MATTHHAILRRLAKGQSIEHMLMHTPSLCLDDIKAAAKAGARALGSIQRAAGSNRSSKINNEPKSRRARQVSTSTPTRRSGLSNAGSRWTHCEVKVLCQRWNYGSDIDTIATLHKRTPLGVKAKLAQLQHQDAIRRPLPRAWRDQPNAEPPKHMCTSCHGGIEPARVRLAHELGPGHHIKASLCTTCAQGKELRR